MKNYLLLLFIFLSLTSYGQKYKLKKDILSKDKVEIAKMEGKVSLVKKDLTISTMDDSQILVVTGGTYSDVFPGNEPLSWYSFWFPQLKREITLKESNSYFNTKQFLKNEFEEKGIHFYADGLHADELEQLEDYSAQLHKDTLNIIDSFRFYKEAFAANHINRPASAPVSFGLINNSPDLLIIQGKDENGKAIIIGKIVYAHNPGMSSSDPGRQHKARIFRKLQNEIVFNGNKTSYLIAGYIDLFESFPRLFLYEDGKAVNPTIYRIDTSKDGLQSAREAAAFMAAKGYL